MLGYQVAVPGQNRLLNGLRWDGQVDPVRWQPAPTIYQRAAATGIDAYRVAARKNWRRPASRWRPCAAPPTGPPTAWARSLPRRPGRWRARTGRWSPSTTRNLTVPATCSDPSPRPGPTSSPTWTSSLSSWRAHFRRARRSTSPPITAWSTPGPDDRIDVNVVPGLRDQGRPAGRRGAGPARVRRARGRGRRPGHLAGRAGRPRLGGLARGGDRRGLVRPGRSSGSPRGSATWWPAQQAPGRCVATKAEPLESSLEGMHGSLTPGDQFVPLLSVTSM